MCTCTLSLCMIFQLMQTYFSQISKYGSRSRIQIQWNYFGDARIPEHIFHIVLVLKTTVSVVRITRFKKKPFAWKSKCQDLSSRLVSEWSLLGYFTSFLLINFFFCFCVLDFVLQILTNEIDNNYIIV